MVPTKPISPEELYRLARETLLQALRECGRQDASKVLSEYLKPPRAPTGNTMPMIYRRFVESAQNANRNAKVIGGAIGGVDRLADVLCRWRPHTVHRQYGGDARALLEDIQATLLVGKAVSHAKNGAWYRFCRSALSSAKFLSQFAEGPEFLAWADHFYRDTRSRPALPLLLSAEVYGFGYTLACDCLKELGFVQFGKPDVHIIDILAAAGLIEQQATPYETQKTLLALSQHLGVTPYELDKLLWLSGSGFFYHHMTLGREGVIPGVKQRMLAALTTAPTANGG